jgi:hypothetical protein
MGDGLAIHEEHRHHRLCLVVFPPCGGHNLRLDLKSRPALGEETVRWADEVHLGPREFGRRGMMRRGRSGVRQNPAKQENEKRTATHHASHKSPFSKEDTHVSWHLDAVNTLEYDRLK